MVDQVQQLQTLPLSRYLADCWMKNRRVAWISLLAATLKTAFAVFDPPGSESLLCSF